MTPLATLDAMPADAFVAALADIFEHSPWVAEAVVAARPFGTVERLHDAMVAAMRRAPREQQLALLRAHPELARVATLTVASQQEQTGAGLAALDEAARARFADLNARYRTRFGFPFIIAVRGRGRDDILAAFEARVQGAPDTEFAAALDEVATIARLRLAQRIAP